MTLGIVIAYKNINTKLLRNLSTEIYSIVIFCIEILALDMINFEVFL